MIILKAAKSLLQYIKRDQCYEISISCYFSLNTGYLFESTVFVLVLFGFVKHKARRVSKGDVVRCGETGCTCSVMPLHLPWSGSAAECSQSRLYQGGGCAGCRGPEGNARGASAALCLPFSTSQRRCIYLLFIRFNLFWNVRPCRCSLVFGELVIGNGLLLIYLQA